MSVSETQILEERARRLALPLTAGEEKSLQVVSFSIGAEKFIIESQYVQEINKLHDYTPVPDTPNFIVGVTNIRGTVLALVDIAKFFTMPSRGITDLTRVIVLGQQQFEFGLLAATAHDALAIEPSDILEVPDGISASTKKYLKGVTAIASLFLDGQLLLSDERLILDQ